MSRNWTNQGLGVFLLDGGDTAAHSSTAAALPRCWSLGRERRPGAAHLLFSVASANTSTKKHIKPQIHQIIRFWDRYG